MTGLRTSPGHLLAAGCFLVLAGLRAAEGSWLWAGVFGLAAVVQGVVGSRIAGRPAAPRPGSGPREAATWKILTVSSCALSAGLLLVQPVLGLVAATVALYCLRAARVHRPTG
ncbi:hypothetical protein [Pseudonocardia sp. MH-G8]|uniref:hypothetical protein n=1 Tax=Pseudonocardia sp. MH-G8 TaxID=1854588 RepID=UPI000BA0291A|nr:hypothetical protein [Pseudonocardia sp. MH-G8]OZM77351.1 hypothetical protein CFP66_36285 [Pseudonocardia sp. MH-G8]